MCEKLKEIIEKYGSDKVLSNYYKIYDKIFNEIKNDVNSVLEIGVGSLTRHHPSSFKGNLRHYPHYKPGGSLRAWRDYFPNAEIFGVDVAEDCRLDEERILTFIFDSTDSKKCDDELKELKFDIIIDDGLHTAVAQRATIKNMFHRVKNNGIYVIEDCGGAGDGKNVFVDYRQDIEEIIMGHEYYFRSNIFFVRKNNSNKGLVSRQEFL